MNLSSFYLKKILITLKMSRNVSQHLRMSQDVSGCLGMSRDVLGRLTTRNLLDLYIINIE